MASFVNCPVDLIVINENRVRVSAFIVFALLLFYSLVPNLFIPAFLVVDFYLRAFQNGKYSLLNWVGAKAQQYGWIDSKPTDRAPKRFAAILGLFFSTLLLLSIVAKLYTVALFIAICIALFAFLESFVGFCVGCYVYVFLNHIKRP